MNLAKGKDVPEKDIAVIREKFRGMMKALFKEEGASLRIELLEDPAVTDFIDEHASVLDSTFSKVEMSDRMRSRLQESDWIFSGMKTFHELNEAFPSLLDESGQKKSFERFLSDVQSIYAGASAEMAAKWEHIEEDGDDYNLQYRTGGDDKVRPEHAALHGVTLPPSDSFWDKYYPPNGWNCRCTVVQVLKDKYPTTDRMDALRRGEEALANDTKGMFRFNSGKQGKTFPDYNPYTISKCNTCSRKLNLVKGIPDSDVCEACQKCRGMAADAGRHSYSLEERISIYARPLEDQFVEAYKEGKAEVRRHLIKSTASEDYDRVRDVAKAFAKERQGIVYLLPEINAHEKDLRQRLGLSTDNGDTPDIMLGVGSFIEVKSPKTETKLAKNAGKASRQSGIACITDHRLPLDEKELDRYARRVFGNETYRYNDVYFYIGGRLYKKTKE